MSRRAGALTAVVLLAFASGPGFAAGQSGTSQPAGLSSPGAIAAGADSRSTPTSSLPDPLARRAAPLSQVVMIIVLVLVAVGVLWLGRRHAEEEWREEAEASPRLRLVERRPDRRHRRAPDFYEDLRRREARLDELQGEEREGRRRKIVEIRPIDGGGAGRPG